MGSAVLGGTRVRPRMRARSLALTPIPANNAKLTAAAKDNACYIRVAAVAAAHVAAVCCGAQVVVLRA